MNRTLIQSALRSKTEVIPDQWVACPLCGEVGQRLFLRGPDRLHHLDGEWTLVQCVRCDFVYQSPRVADDVIDHLYPVVYEPFQQTVDDHDGYIGRELRKTAAFVNARAPQGASLLDVGCGAGDFLAAMRRLYPAWQLTGIEPNANAAALAAGRGLSVQQGTLDSVPESPKYDVITLWNVLEHLTDPRRLLAQVRHMLAPNGTLCLAVPVYDSWEARLFGQYWVGWELPRHMLAFNRNSIMSLLQQFSFNVVQQACISGTYYGVVQSAVLASEAAISSWALRRLIAAMMYSQPTRVALKPYILLAEWMKCGTVLTIAARRAEDVQE